MRGLHDCCGGGGGGCAMIVDPVFVSVLGELPCCVSID